MSEQWSKGNNGGGWRREEMARECCGGGRVGAGVKSCVDIKGREGGGERGKRKGESFE